MNLDGFYSNFDVLQPSRNPSNSLENSESGALASSLLPIGNSLQASFIFLYEWRNNPTSVNSALPASGTPLITGQFFYGLPGQHYFTPTVPPPGVQTGNTGGLSLQPVPTEPVFLG